MPRKGTETGSHSSECDTINDYLEMRCPGRGRKHTCHCFVLLWNMIWKWDAPEGDGNCSPRIADRTAGKVFGNEMPRKGTETLSLAFQENGFPYLEMRCPGRGRKRVIYFHHFSKLIQFGNEMPRKGTETFISTASKFTDIFGNEMPRKGTEISSPSRVLILVFFDLEMRCPGRGRKW